MMKLSFSEQNDAITFPAPRSFDLAQIFNCGQCFRFRKIDETTYGGVAFGRYLEVSHAGNSVILKNATVEDFHGIWFDFFDLGTDYSEIYRSFSFDTHLFDACTYSAGMRILRQDPWETLCSFIISQNNNIPRIKGIIDRLSQRFGARFEESDGHEHFAFPTPEALLTAGEEAIFACGTGFRAKYLYDAAKKVSEGEIDLSQPFRSSTEEGLSYLQRIKGVGVKVASCVLLFAYHKYDAFPIDVWVKKILEKHFAEGTTAAYFGPYAGIAQQCLFYYERCSCGVFLNS